MNLEFRHRDKLIIINKPIDKAAVGDIFAKCIYDHIYLENEDGDFVGFLNYPDFLNSKGDVCFQRHVERENDIDESEYEEFFRNHPDRYRYPVIKCGRLEGEYAIEGYDGKDIQCRYNEFAFQWFLYFISEFVDIIRGSSINKICILAEKRYWGGFADKLSGHNVFYCIVDSTDDIPDDVNYVLNMKYPEQLRKLISKSEIQGESLYEMTEGIVYSKMISYLRTQGIHYLYFEGPSKKKLDSLWNDEIDAIKYQGNLAAFIERKEYLNKVSKDIVWDNSQIVFNGRYYELADYCGENYNVRKGCRSTVGQPITDICSIHIFGPCIAQGFFVKDGETIASFLQADYRLKEMDVIVENHGINGMGSLLNSCIGILSTPLRKGDYVIEINTCFSRALNTIKNQGYYHELSSIFHDRHYWFFNHPFHCNAYANEIIAKEIEKSLVFDLNASKNQTRVSYFAEDEADEMSLFITNGIRQFLKENKNEIISHSPNEKCGAIVMTADPFTLGHFYLVESALKQADYIYIFIVKEETGTYSFSDRCNMIKNALAAFKNVRILSTGEFMHSVYTFPEYNLRGIELGRQVDASREIMLFADWIAPFFDITMRFFGDEPTDSVTRALNESACNILPKYGITPIIVPRKKVGTEYISGTKVRMLIKKHKWEELKSYIPETSLSYLRNKENEKQGKKARVSLLIPVFNNERQIRDLINEAEKQKFDVDEIVVVDGGSSDQSKAIIEKEIHDDHGIRAFYLSDNSGLASAIDTAVHKAQGRYVMFITKGIRIRESCLNVLCEIAEEYRADMVIAGYANDMELWNEPTAQNEDVHAHLGFATGYELCNHLFSDENCCESRDDLSFSCKLIKRDLIKEFTIKSSQKYSEILVMGKLYRRLSRVIQCNIPLFFMEDDSKPCHSDCEYVSELIEYADELMKYYKEPQIKYSILGELINEVKRYCKENKDDSMRSKVKEHMGIEVF